jgi:hypothetical protein
MEELHETIAREIQKEVISTNNDSIESPSIIVYLKNFIPHEPFHN